MYVSHDRSVCPSIYVCVYHMTGLFVHLYVRVNVCMYHMTGLFVHLYVCMYISHDWTIHFYVCRLIHVDDHHSGHTDNKVDFSRADKVSLVVKYVVL